MNFNDNYYGAKSAEKSVIDADSKIIICGIASYQNNIGTLQNYLAKTGSGRIITRDPEYLRLEQQLKNCYNQIQHLKVNPESKIGVFSDSKDIKHLVDIKHITPWSTSIENSKFIETNCSSKSILSAASHLTDGTIDLAIVVDSRNTIYGDSVFLVAFALENSNFAKIVELESFALCSESNTKTLLFKNHEQGKPTSLPGLIAINDASLVHSIDDLVQENQELFKNLYLSVLTDSKNLGLLAGLVHIILSVITKTKIAYNDTPLYPFGTVSKINQVELTRPWVQKQTINKKLPRIGALHYKENNVHALVRIRESLTKPYYPLPFSIEKSDSETLFISAMDISELLENIRLVSNYIEKNPETRLLDLAYTFNCNFIEKEHKHRIGLVASDLVDLSQKLSFAYKKLQSGETMIHNEGLGVYYRSETSSVKGKMAYLLPGLGSSYVGMLEDLYNIHPLTQSAFDSLDSIALDNPESGCPSELIFPTEIEQSKSQTALIEADFAVTSVLISSFALDSILKEAKLIPDAYLGLSTGELGSYILNGFTSIEEAAPLFYKLNIDVSKNIPKDLTKNLITANVFCSVSKVNKTIEGLNLPVYVIADLGPQHTMVTGDSSSIGCLVAKLKESNIVSVNMQVAIPYHTPLVETSLNDEVVRKFRQSLNFSSVNIPSWSCSIADKAPFTDEEIEIVSKTMFKKQIRLRETIEKMYKDGVKVFVEVGPNSILTNKVKEILNGKDFIAMASNLSNCSALTQLHHLKALLFANGKTPELKTWYKNRAAKLVNSISTIEPSKESNLVTSVTEFSNLPTSNQQESASIELPKDEVVKAFFVNLNKLHKSTIAAQNELVKNYLAVKATTNKLLVERTTVSNSSLSWIKFDNFDCSEPSIDQLIQSNFTLKEQAFFARQFKNTKRKLQHIFGRLAAKDAVSSLIEKGYSVKLSYNQIEILNSDDGIPGVVISSTNEFKNPRVSISHCMGFACAVALDSEEGRLPGVDVEKVKQLDLDLPELVLSPKEYKNLVLYFSKESERTNGFLKLWTAKEAAYKALGGSGLKQFIWSPKSSSESEIALSYEKQTLKVKTLTIGEYIVSIIQAKARKAPSLTTL